MSKYVEKVAKRLYKKMASDARKSLFPGKASQMSQVFGVLSQAFYPDVSEDNLTAEQIEAIHKFYITVYTRKIIMPQMLGSSASTTDEAIIHVTPEFPPTSVQKGIDISKTILYNQFPKAAQLAQALEMRAQMVAEGAKVNKGIENEFIDDSEYGLVLSKPVFVAGFEAEYDYVARLKSADGIGIKYDRIGSMGIDGVNGSIDIYEIQFDDGRPGVSIYINLYSFVTSTKAPRGFILEG